MEINSGVCVTCDRKSTCTLSSNYMLFCSILGKSYIKEAKQELDEQLKITDVRSHNVEKSDYSKHKIQPWSILDLI